MIPAFLIKWFGPSTARIVFFAFIALVVLLALAGLARSCTPEEPAAQVRQDAKSADAYAGAAKEAVATVVASGERDASVDAVVNQAVKEIDNAPNPVAARAAVVRSVCGMRAYANRPECTVQRSNP